MDKGVMQAVHALLMMKAQGVKAPNPVERPLGEFPAHPTDVESAKSTKPHTQRKIPQEMMDELLKKKIYSMSPESATTDEGLSLINKGF
jgi:hypothetical protein